MNIHDISASIANLVSGMESKVFGIRSGHRRGSGFSPEDGLVITAAHNLENGDTVTVVDDREKESEAKILGRDRRIDLAVLEFDDSGVPGESANSDSLAVGHLVFPLGRPGRSLRAAFGMISAIGGSWTLPHGREISRYIEVDGALPRGFSGGPLLDATGRIVGMNSSFPRGSGMTVPMPDIISAVGYIRKHGELRSAYLGVNTVPVPLDSPDDSQKSGLIITEVEKQSPADRAGLKQGDLLLQIGVNPVTDIGALMSILASGIAGEELGLTIRRAGEIRELKVVFGRR